MARGRGGYGRRRGSSHARRGLLDEPLNGSTTNGDGNETSQENLIVTNLGSGSNIDSSQNPSHGETREHLIVEDGQFDKSSDCSRTMTRIFRERIDDKAYTWTKVSNTTKNFYFEEFKKNYVWDAECDAKVKKAWNAKATLRYNDMFRDVRRIGEKPPYMTEDAWRNFTAYWDTPKYKEKREINKQNRLKGEGSSTHTGGSISYAEHAKKLKSVLKRPPTPFELFLHTHTKGHDNQTFVNARSRTINDNMMRLRKIHEENHASGGTDSRADESALYHEAAGGVKKRRVYGRGPIIRDQTLLENVTTTSKEDDGWKDKYLTAERRVRKLTRKTQSLEQTLEIVCQRVGVPIVGLNTDTDDSDQGEDVGDAHQNTNTSLGEGTSEDHHDILN